MKYLVIDVGNTNTVFALFEKKQLVKKWRTSTIIKRTTDEYLYWFKSIIENENDFKDIIIGSVVPDITEELKQAIVIFFKKKALVISEDIKINFPSEVDNPSEVGTDRIVNSLCAWNLYKKPTIIIDLGTATTFDIVGNKGAYIGGIIAPGVNLSMMALHQAAARLPRVAIKKPENVIGKNTVSAMSSGIYWGYVGLIENLINKIENELNYKMHVVATGGLAKLFISQISKNIILNNDLTIHGLFMAYQESIIIK